jgi:hypothetical protein
MKPAAFSTHEESLSIFEGLEPWPLQFVLIKERPGCHPLLEEDSLIHVEELIREITTLINYLRKSF